MRIFLTQPIILNFFIYQWSLKKAWIHFEKFRSCFWKGRMTSTLVAKQEVLILFIKGDHQNWYNLKYRQNKQQSINSIRKFAANHNVSSSHTIENWHWKNYNRQYLCLIQGILCINVVNIKWDNKHTGASRFTTKVFPDWYMRAYLILWSSISSIVQPILQQ